MADDKKLEPTQDPKIDPLILETVIVDPNSKIYEGQTIRVFVPTPNGEIALLPQHTPLYAEITKGEIKIEEKDGKTQKFEVDGGIARIKQNSLKILVGF